jgi:glycosyltransferase involved in cell wall biosynthesis
VPCNDDNTRSIAALIPALDCAATIGEVVRGARRHLPLVLVVDDGSSDRTANQAESAGAEVLRHSQRRGKGAALRTGMEALAARGVSRALTMDGDGQHLASEIPALLAESDADPHALIIGARRIAPGSVASKNLFGNRFANRWVEIASGVSLPDTQSGFRVYPLAEVGALGVRAGHFAFETEVLVRAARAGIPIRSVAVNAYYPPIEERRSHYRPFVDTVRIIFVVLGLILNVRRYGGAEVRK